MGQGRRAACMCDCTTLMTEYFNFRVMCFEECVGWTAPLVADAFKRPARERWAVCEAYGKDKRIYEWRVTWFNPASRHAIKTLTRTHTCIRYPILPLLSRKGFDVTVKRRVPQIICSPGRCSNAPQRPPRGVTEHHKVYFRATGTSVGLRGARCYFL